MAAFLLGGLYLGARIISPSYLKADPAKLQESSNNRIKGSSSAGAMATDRESPVWKDGVKSSDIPKWEPNGEKRKRKKPKNVVKVAPADNNKANDAVPVPDSSPAPADSPAAPAPSPTVSTD